MDPTDQVGDEGLPPTIAIDKNEIVIRTFIAKTFCPFLWSIVPHKADTHLLTGPAVSILITESDDSYVVAAHMIEPPERAPVDGCVQAHAPSHRMVPDAADELAAARRLLAPTPENKMPSPIVPRLPRAALWARPAAGGAGRRWAALRR